LPNYRKKADSGGLGEIKVTNVLVNFKRIVSGGLFAAGREAQPAKAHTLPPCQPSTCPFLLVKGRFRLVEAATCGVGTPSSAQLPERSSKSKHSKITYLPITNNFMYFASKKSNAL
jgi:hypothetical protein